VPRRTSVTPRIVRALRRKKSSPERRGLVHPPARLSSPEDAPPSDWYAAELQFAIRSGTLKEREFAAHVPKRFRKLSSTPLAAAALAAGWCASRGARRLLDVGSGVGKFAIVGAAVSNLRIDGIERNAQMVEVARALAQQFGVAARVEFRAIDQHDVPLQDYDAVYVFDPPDVAAVARSLDRMRPRSHLVAYQRLDGPLLESWALLQSVGVASGRLRLWQKLG